MKTYTLRGASVLALAVGLSIAPTAFAQTETQQPTTTPTQAGPGPDRDRDVVVVTAQKREETVQDVPVAITAVTSETRDELGINTITDLTNLTPGLSYSTFTDFIFLRGVGRYTNIFGAEPGVANYSDGIYQSLAITAGRNNIFVDRIEVLRGPQGTLYGRNSIGGALNVISKRPSDTLEREVRIGMGNYDYRLAAFAVSGPLTDDVRGRIAGSWEDREGFFTNVATGEKDGGELGEYFLEGQLEGDIGDRFSWWVKAMTADWDKSGPPGGQINVGESSPYEMTFAPPGSIMPSPAWAFSGNPLILDYQQLGNVTTNPAETDLTKFNRNEASYAIFDAYHEYTGEAVYSMDDFDIKWLGGYVFYKYHYPGDQDQTPVKSITYLSSPTGAPQAGGTPRTIYPEWRLDYRESRAFFSNELNLISTGQGPLQWILGLYAYQETSHQPISSSLPNEPLADAALSLVTGQMIANPDRLLSLSENRNLFNAYGAYGQLDYAVNDQWKGTLGLRYSSDNKKITEDGLLRCLIVCGAPFVDITPIVFSGASPGFVGPQPGVVTATPSNPSGVIYDPVTGRSTRTMKDSWDAVTGTLGFEYRPMDDTLLFARYSRGYKSGGFNTYNFSPLPESDEETNDSYELGWKQEVRDWGLTANVSLFHYDYHDAQIPLTEVPDLGQPRLAFVNIPKIESNGFELETNWQPTDDLNLLFTYAYLDSTIADGGDSYFNSVTQAPENVTGNPVPLSSKNKIAFNARYTFHLPDGSTLMPSVNYFWRDSFASEIFSNPLAESPAYDQTDLRLIWNDASGQYTVMAYAKNVFDELGYDRVSASLRRSNGVVYQTITPTPPRLLGAELHIRF